VTIDPDRILDRRRLKLRVVLWRTLAILALVVLAIALIARFGFGGHGDHRIARLWLDDLVVDEPQREAALRALADDNRVRALIVRIDSPGGAVAAGDALFHALRRVAERKPVVAVMGATATSAAYMAALGADRIFARETTVTGAIGVVLQNPDIAALFARLGIETDARTASSSSGETAGEAANAALADLRERFIGLVAERRNLPPEAVRTIADGRIFTGRQAKSAKLVDALGGEDEARAWLASTQAIALDMAVQDVARPARGAGLLRAIGERLAESPLPSRLRLDGAVSVWQAELAK